LSDELLLPCLCDRANLAAPARVREEGREGGREGGGVGGCDEVGALKRTGEFLLPCLCHGSDFAAPARLREGEEGGRGGWVL